MTSATFHSRENPEHSTEEPMEPVELASFCLILSPLILSPFILSLFILSPHLVSPHFVSIPLVSLHLASLHLVSFCLVSPLSCLPSSHFPSSRAHWSCVSIEMYILQRQIYIYIYILWNWRCKPIISVRQPLGSQTHVACQTFQLATLVTWLKHAPRQKVHLRCFQQTPKLWLLSYW